MRDRPAAYALLALVFAAPCAAEEKGSAHAGAWTITGFADAAHRNPSAFTLCSASRSIGAAGISLALSRRHDWTLSFDNHDWRLEPGRPTPIDIVFDDGRPVRLSGQASEDTAVSAELSDSDLVGKIGKAAQLRAFVNGSQLDFDLSSSAAAIAALEGCIARDERDAAPAPGTTGASPRVGPTTLTSATVDRHQDAAAEPETFEPKPLAVGNASASSNLGIRTVTMASASLGAESEAQSMANLGGLATQGMGSVSRRVRHEGRHMAVRHASAPASPGAASSATREVSPTSTPTSAAAFEPAKGPPPDFVPWPPPQPSALYRYRAEWVIQHATIGQLSADLETMLSQSGYTEFSYSLTPGGFALATRFERLDPSDAPRKDIQRWTSLDSPLPSGWWDKAKSLLGHAEDRCRLFVFFLTTDDRAPSKEPAKLEDAKRWSRSGMPSLPPELATASLTSAHIFYVYEYEFRREPSNAIAELDEGQPLDQQLKLVGLLR